MSLPDSDVAVPPAPARRGSRVFLLDIDGTLIASGGAGRAALAEAMQAAFGIAQRQPVDLHGRTDRGIGRSLLEGHGLENSEANWRRLRDVYLKLLPAKLRERQGRVLPGVVPMLQQLAADPRAAVGLLTGNVRRGADIKLQHFALDCYVNSTCFGGYGDVQDCRNRLAADALRSARAAVGADLRECDVWVIGDTPRDVDCARAIGARAAAVATGGYSADQLAASRPDLLLETLEAASDLLM